MTNASKIVVGTFIVATSLVVISRFSFKSMHLLPQVAAVPLPADCPPDQFCGRIIDMTGGCITSPCCPPNLTMCEPHESKLTQEFPRVAASNPGTCIRISELEVPTCKEWDCGNATTCAQGTCSIVGPPRFNTAREYESTGQACPAGTLN